MSSRILRALVLTAAVSLPALALAQAKPPLASVNGSPITEEDLKVAQDDIGSTMPQGSDAQKRKYLVDYLVDLKLLAQSAEKQKMADGIEFARKVAYLRDRALMEALMAKEGAAAVNDEKIKAFYDEAVKGLPKDEEARARHILVPTENEAKDIAARIKKGEDFAKLATELSKDPGSGKQGGDLGYFTKDRMVKEFAETAFALKPGEVSAPVKSQFGWHIIKLEDRRAKEPPKLEDVKDELSRYLTQKAQQDMIVKLRADSKIDLADEFKPAAPAPAPAAPAAPAEKPKP
jgi:peptidyl-prolyl cis-trans isomerase C